MREIVNGPGREKLTEGDSAELGVMAFPFEGTRVATNGVATSGVEIETLQTIEIDYTRGLEGVEELTHRPTAMPNNLAWTEVPSPSSPSNQESDRPERSALNTIGVRSSTAII